MNSDRHVSQNYPCCRYLGRLPGILPVSEGEESMNIIAQKLTTYRKCSRLSLVEFFMKRPFALLTSTSTHVGMQERKLEK